MATFLYHLGRWAYTHPKRIIATWLLLLVAIATTALSIQKGYNDLFEIDDVPTVEATRMLMEKFPGTANPAAAADVTIVYQAPEGRRLDEPEFMRAMDATAESLVAHVPNMGEHQRLGNPVVINEAMREAMVSQLTEQGLPQETAEKDFYTQRVVSDDGRIGSTTFAFDVPLPADVTNADREAVNQAIRISEDAGLRVEVGGPGFGDPVKVEPISEAAGVVVALIILVVTFASILAAGLPLVTAIVGVGIGALVTTGATAFTPLNSMTPTLGLMIGLAVGIDYALFIMARYRDEIRQGKDRVEAIGLAVGTAGSAVVFAGVTVIIALVGLRLADIGFLSAMGYAAAFFVAVGVLVALTLLPAMLGVLGERVFRADASRPRAERPLPATRKRGLKDSLGTRWVRLVVRFPGVALALVMAVLGALTVPALNLQLSLPNDMTGNVNSTQRQAAELLAEGFGPGRNAPMLILVDASSVDVSSPALEPLVAATADSTGAGSEEGGAGPARMASFIYVMSNMQNNPEVEHVQLIGMSEDETTAQLVLTPKHGPRDESTVQLISQLRQQQQELEQETGVEMGITGLIPIQQDVTDRLEAAMPIYLALVVGLAVLLLMMVFRSVLIPLMAAVGFLLSIGAAFGVTVLVWQEGLWGIWDSPGPLISFMPIFLIGVTFGLAMDYQVFIVSRMYERYTHRKQAGGDNLTDDAIVNGFALGAKVVTAAALIMIGVFASFIFQPLPFIQIFGFALGFGVLFDAFFIRMTAIPALMSMFGSATWYMPRWLDRVLPTVDVEGSKLNTEQGSDKAAH